MTNLQDLAERTVKKVIRLGATHCDVIAIDSRYVVAEIEKSSMKQASTITDSGIGIRAFKNGSSGYSYTTGRESKAIDRAAKLAVSQAAAGTLDSDFKDLPVKEMPAKVEGLFEARIARMEPDAVVDMAISLSNAASSDKRIVAVNASVAVGSGEVALANSNDFSRGQRLTSFAASAESVARSGSNMFSSVDGVWSRKLEKPLLSAGGRNAMEHAIQGLKSRKLSTGDYPVVLDPLSAGFIIVSAIGGGANAESVQKKRSYLTGRIGQSIGVEGLTIHDDPTITWALGSYAFDGEGTPGRRNAIVDHGVLRSYLHDSYTAGKDGIRSTGNASRGGANWSYRQPPTISSSNIVVSKGQDSFEEMIEETRKGVYLRITYDYPNLTTGEFSGLMMESYVIDKGEIGPSIQQSTIGIGMVDLFSRIDMMGKKQRDAFGVRVPPMRISKARIGGSG
jgi:PmbA protein